MPDIEGHLRWIEKKASEAVSDTDVDCDDEDAKYTAECRQREREDEKEGERVVSDVATVALGLAKGGEVKDPRSKYKSIASDVSKFLPTTPGQSAEDRASDVLHFLTFVKQKLFSDSQNVWRGGR